MMKDIYSIAENLPMIDCGSCGAPTCMAFAEDIVKGEANADECTVIMRQLFHEQLAKYKENSIFDKLKPRTEKGEDGE
jgi:CO dehydrogenase/acetyl-CoA synthase gamma subunit (corrinoid Fe-S protein)